VSLFLASFLRNRTIRSWWSFGWIRFHIVAYARMTIGENRIVKELPGSDHPHRKYPKSGKIAFYSEKVFHREWLESRWGKQYSRVLEFCDSDDRLFAIVQRGIGQVMANLVFFHSVPDNIPGIFWSEGKAFVPLFGNRTLPSWVIDLFERPPSAATSPRLPRTQNLSAELKELLVLVRRGVRSPASIARRLDCDQRHVIGLLAVAFQAGFITPSARLLPAGREALIASGEGLASVNYKMYIPQSWCAP
jgi:hypothetical protein